MATPTLRRVEAMLAELDKIAEEYTGAKEQFDAARIVWESAKARFAGVRRLASGVLSPMDWWRWRIQHANAQYAGLKIGDAIVEVLTTQAFESAEEHFSSDGGHPFSPAMAIEQIQETLERGGFEFRSSTPLREVNAALINTEGIKKKSNGYELADADMIFEMCKPETKETEEAEP